MLAPRVELIQIYTDHENVYKKKIEEIQSATRSKTAKYDDFSYDKTVKALRTEFKDKLEKSNIDEQSVEGGGGTGQNEIIQHHTHDLKKKNSKRRLLKLKQLIKTLKRHYKKKKQNYTRRRQQHS